MAQPGPLAAALRARLRTAVHPVTVGIAFAFLARLWLILRFPNNFAFDAWQRWAGREHILVQDWLPGLQVIIAVVAELGGGVRVTRIVLAAIAALGVGAGTAAAGSIGGRSAAWLFAGLATFGPTLVWSGLLYQEGLYTTVLLTGLALALRAGTGLSPVRQAGRPWGLLLLADLVFGALPLVRYEGWVVVFGYLAWRHDASALRALWGEALWVGLKFAGVRGFYPSRVDYFEDWRQLGPRFDPERWIGHVLDLGNMLSQCGGLAVLLVGLAGAGMCWRARGIPLASFALAVHIAATLAWVAGLETATQRMLVLPVSLAVLPAAVGGAEVWERVPRLRTVISAAIVLWLGLALYVARDTVDRERSRVRPEVMALGRMQACKDCFWWIVPRQGLGSQGRDDGCEILQGMTRMKEGEQFWCAPWIDGLPATERAKARAQTNGVVRWSATDRQTGQYVVEVAKGPGEPTTP